MRLQEESFLQVALAAIPRVTELIAAFPDDERASARGCGTPLHGGSPEFRL
jgi:hypothetical protein